MRSPLLATCAMCVFCVLTGELCAQQAAPRHQLRTTTPGQTRIAPINLADANSTARTASGDKTTALASKQEEETWDIAGPIRLRSADPEPTGDLEFKNIFDFSTSSDGSDDDLEYEFEIEYGIAPNHELIFELPVQLGDGSVKGNADITLGHHWRLWKEQELLPAFAIRNYLRLPSGHDSSGVDWELRGLLTKSIIPNKFRLHLNPFLKNVNGHNQEDYRHFQWGAIVGVDYRINKCLTIQADYIHETSESEGWRNQHTAEVGLEWKIAPQHELAFVTRADLDGDSEGENWGFGISYIFEFENVPHLGSK